LARAREFRALIEILQPRQGHRLLDLGCGSGFYARPLKNTFGMEVMGLDSSNEMLAAAGVPGWNCDATDMTSVPGDTFDVVLAAGLLEFVEQPARVFRNATRVLREGGRLVLLVPRTGPWGLAYEWIHRWRGCPSWARRPELYIELARMNGLKFTGRRDCTPISVALAFTKDGHGAL
jgi:ubiquinone/menaquinone biosynthesis C-methylase UbiE